MVPPHRTKQGTATKTTDSANNASNDVTDQMSKVSIPSSQIIYYSSKVKIGEEEFLTENTPPASPNHEMEFTDGESDADEDGSLVATDEDEPPSTEKKVAANVVQPCQDCPRLTACVANLEHELSERANEVNRLTGELTDKASEADHAIGRLNDMTKKYSMAKGSTIRARARVDNLREIAMACGTCAPKVDATITAAAVTAESLITKDCDHVKLFAKWETYDSDSSAGVARLDQFFSFWNNWIETRVRSSDHGDEILLTRDRIRVDGIIDMVARAPLSSMLNSEADLAAKAEGGCNGHSLASFKINKEIANVRGAKDRIAKAAINNLIGTTVWPAQALLLLMKFYTMDSDMGNTDLAIYDVVVILAYAAAINRAFGEMTNRRGGQLDFVAYQPNTDRTMDVNMLIKKAMDYGFEIHRTKGDFFSL